MFYLVGFKKIIDYLYGDVFFLSKVYECVIGVLEVYYCIIIIGLFGLGKIIIVGKLVY